MGMQLRFRGAINLSWIDILHLILNLNKFKNNRENYHFFTFAYLQCGFWGEVGALKSVLLG